MICANPWNRAIPCHGQADIVDGLVEQQHGGPCHDDPREFQLAALTSAQVSDALVDVFQSEKAVADQSSDESGFEPGQPFPIDLQNGPLFARQVGRLRQVADVYAWRPAHGATVGRLQAREQTQERLFARAVGANKANMLAGVEGERHIVEDSERTIRFREVRAGEQHVRIPPAMEITARTHAYAGSMPRRGNRVMCW